MKQAARRFYLLSHVWPFSCVTASLVNDFMFVENKKKLQTELAAK